MKKNTFKLTTLVALLTFAVSGLGQSFKEDYKIITTPEIILNHNTKTQRTKTYKDEKLGVRDLQNLVKTSNYEQGMIFSPNYLNSDSSTWENVTKRMRIDGEGFEIDTLQLENIMKKNNKIIDYHFHPSPKIFRDSLSLSEESKEKTKKYQRIDSSIDYNFIFNEFLENKFAERAMPSITDLVYMIDNTIKYSEINPLGEISFKLCSEFGVTEYFLTVKGKKIFKKRGNWILIGGENNNQKNKRDNPLITYIFDRDLDAYQTTRLFSAQIESKLQNMVKINFKSYEEFYNSP